MLIIADYLRSRLRITSYNSQNRNAMVGLLNTLTGMKKYYQTDHYVPTPHWERVLQQGSIPNEGLILLVVQWRRQVIGYARMFPEENEGQKRKTGNIGLGLLEDYQQQGIGRQLIEKLTEMAPSLGYSALAADVLESNIPSVKVFAHCGFLPVQQKKVFLPFLSRNVLEMRFEKNLDRTEEIYGGRKHAEYIT